MANLVSRSGFDLLLALLGFSLAAGLATLCSLGLSKMGGTFAQAVAPGAKIVSLEGLRGILAFSVALHHACCWYYYMRIGEWTTGQNIVFERFATFGVVQFFYISGYLFWRKLMRGPVPLGRFYLSRFLRIGPVYYVCVGSAILISVVETGPHLFVTLLTLARSLTSWLLFCLGGLPSVNGADTKRIVAGVMWTLALEWGFYLLLPFLGWFARKAGRLLWFALLFAAIHLLSGIASHALVKLPHLEVALLEIKSLAKFMLIGFGGGILVAALEPQLRKLNRLSPKQASALLLVLYSVYLFVPGVEIWGQILLLCGFVLVTQGTDLFGLLTSRGIRLLGIVSYDIYVAHGIIFYLATRVRGGIHPVPLASYLPQTALCLILLVLTAIAIHFAVERPTMLLSERIAQRPKPALAPAPAISA